MPQIKTVLNNLGGMDAVTLREQLKEQTGTEINSVWAMGVCMCEAHNVLKLLQTSGWSIEQLESIDNGEAIQWRQDAMKPYENTYAVRDIHGTFAAYHMATTVVSEMISKEVHGNILRTRDVDGRGQVEEENGKDRCSKQTMEPTTSVVSASILDASCGAHVRAEADVEENGSCDNNCNDDKRKRTYSELDSVPDVEAVMIPDARVQRTLSDSSVSSLPANCDIRDTKRMKQTTTTTVTVTVDSAATITITIPNHAEPTTINIVVGSKNEHSDGVPVPNLGNSISNEIPKNVQAQPL